MPEITIQTEPVDAWQPLGCISCLKPAVDQETAFLDGERLNVSVRNCGDPDCKGYATQQALEMAIHPRVQEMAG